MLTRGDNPDWSQHLCRGLPLPGPARSDAGCRRRASQERQPCMDSRRSLCHRQGLYQVERATEGVC